MSSNPHKRTAFTVVLQVYTLVIVDYPRSGDLIDDFRRCMLDTGNYGRSEIVDFLSKEVQNRLLHIGKRFQVRTFR